MNKDVNIPSLIIAISFSVSLLLLLFFSPFLTAFLGVIAMCFCARNDSMYVIPFYVLVLLVIISLSINATSFEIASYAVDDFTAYYNNFIETYYAGLTFETMFQWRIDFVIPVLNYIFGFFVFKSPESLLFSYSVTFFLLLILLIEKIAIRYELDFKKKVMLYVFVFIFLKTGALFQALRQGFATIFILLSYYSLSKKSYIYGVLAIFSHFSSFIILPITFILLNTNEDLKFKLTISLGLAMCGLMLFAGDIINNPYIASYFGFTLSAYLSGTGVYGLSRLIYLVPLVFFLILAKKNEEIRSIRNTTICMILLTIPTIFLLGAFRVFAPIYFIALGVIYYRLYIHLSSKLKILCVTFMMLLWSFTNYNWTKDGNYFYVTFPKISNELGYFIDTYFLEEKHYIDRQSLPWDREQ
ncbi:EpsG family protein [Vibrio mimicus]